MEVLPAIDLAGGRVVRLVRGDFASATAFSDDPLAVAARFAAAGARWLHVVDLDAARDGARSPRHAALLRALAAGDGLLQVGGGLRSAAAVDAALDDGADRVLVSTLAVRDPQAFAALVARHGDRVCLAADSLAGSVRIAGWAEDSGLDTVEEVRRQAAAGVSAFLVTAIDRDGTGLGPDIALYERLRAATSATLLASGGVGGADDVRRLAAAGCDGVVIGRALYDGSLDLETALAIAR